MVKDNAIRRAKRLLAEKLRLKAQEAQEAEDAEMGSPAPAPLEMQSSLLGQVFNPRPVVDPSIVIPPDFHMLSTGIEEVKREKSAWIRAWPRALHSIKKMKPKPRSLSKPHDTFAKDLEQVVWHTLSIAEICQKFNVIPLAGLAADEAASRLREHGPNAPSPAKSNLFKTIFGYFFKGFGGIVLVGSALVWISWRPLGQPPAVANMALAIVLMVVFFLQGLFSMHQDWQSSRVMTSIKNMIPGKCEVTRDGRPIVIPARDLVVGDIVSIKAGNKLPADLRFIKASSDVRFDRSVLTGESVPVSGSVDSTDSNYLETRNIGLQGTHCMVGSATGIVVSTGDDTVFGRIASLTNEPKSRPTSVEKEIISFVWVIFSIMAFMIILVVSVWAGWLRKAHPNWINVPTLIVDCVSVAIAFIPEGLPIAICLGLSITARKMKRSSILCKSLKTVETLGAVSVICSDKTGTLTEGKMAVTGCVVGAERMTVEEAKQQSASQEGSSAMTVLGAMSVLCNAADVDLSDVKPVPASELKIFGDATDTAILRFAEELRGGNIAQFRACWQQVFELAFSSKYKFMMRCFRNTLPETIARAMPAEEAAAFQADDILMTIKGAPDVLIGRCSRYLTASGAVETLDAAAKQSIVAMKDQYSEQGRRCIVLAQKMVRDGGKMGPAGSSQLEAAMNGEATRDLIFVGLVAIVDPLRPDIRAVVSALRAAGIRVAMVTGDFNLTALAIAREAGIVTSEYIDDVAALARTPDSGAEAPHPAGPATAKHRGGAMVISGPELIDLSQHQWDELIQYEEIVFARTTPEQKLKIVREFQSKGVVAMTGDGVNDAPSLKAADVGICMGSGSDIAMEAADMILLESFASIVAAVGYGRVVFDNLKKVIAYLLPAGSFSEFWPVFCNVCFGLPQILSSFLMIVICCMTDCVAATVLAYEQAEADVMQRLPRDPKKDRLVNAKLIGHAYGLIGMIETTASFAMSFWYLERRGIRFRDLWFSFGEIPAGIDKEYYDARLVEASSIYFVNLVVMQWFNLLATRTRRLSIFQHPPVGNKQTQNLRLFPSMVLSLVSAVMWLYPPPLQRIFATSGVPTEYWFFPFAFGMLLILIDEGRRFLARKYPKGIVARLAW